MKKLFFIFSLLGVVITAIGCSNHQKQVNATEATSKIPLLEKQNKSVIEDVNVEKFSTLIAEKKVQLLDVRTPEEWQEGIINEAIKMNYYDDNFSEQLKTLNKNEPIYVYCKSGNRSRKAATQMEEMGFTKIYNLVGGFSAWRGAAKNVSK